MMIPPAASSFLGASVVVLATVLAPVAVQAQSTNTTIQNGRININQTYQQGSINTNATSQTGLININRTIQIGSNTGNRTGSFGWFDPIRTASGRGFQGAGFDHNDNAHGHGQRHGEALWNYPHDKERK